MYSANARASAFGIVTPYSRPRSISVCGRTEPSRWQCNSAFGNRRSTSRVIVVGTAVAARDESKDGAGLQCTVGVDRQATAVGQDFFAGANGSGDGGIE